MSWYIENECRFFFPPLVWLIAPVLEGMHEHETRPNPCTKLKPSFFDPLKTRLGISSFPSSLHIPQILEYILFDLSSRYHFIGLTRSAFSLTVHSGGARD
jgi:hypothetical protein